MNKEQENLLDEIYDIYCQMYEKDNSIGLTLLVALTNGRAVYRKHDKEMFIAMCMYDQSFSKKWGLKIEERELTVRERYNLGKTNNDYEFDDFPFLEDKVLHQIYDEANIPTKLITLTYNGKTIESYE